MRLAIATAVLTLAVVITPATEAAKNTCTFGRVRGFVAIRSNPVYLVGTIPNQWTSSRRYFSRRYNCLGRGVTVRRFDLGVYDVSFTGQRPKVVLVTAISDSGVTASARPFGDFVRVALRGPLGGDDVASRRDVPFSIAIY